MVDGKPDCHTGSDIPWIGYFLKECLDADGKIIKQGPPYVETGCGTDGEDGQISVHQFVVYGLHGFRVAVFGLKTGIL